MTPPQSIADKLSEAGKRMLVRLCDTGPIAYRHIDLRTVAALERRGLITWRQRESDFQLMAHASASGSEVRNLLQEQVKP